MQLRFLRKASRVGRVWPPTDLPEEARTLGCLIAVRRIGDRISLTVLHERQEHVVFLDRWTPPPSLDDVEGTLTRLIGQAMDRVADAEIGAGGALPDTLGF